MGIWGRILGRSPGGPQQLSFRADGTPGFGVEHEFKLALTIGTPADVDAFMQWGMSPNARVEYSSTTQTPLINAVSNPRHALAMVQVLLAHGADPNGRAITRDPRTGGVKSSQTALQHMAHHGTWQLKRGEACEVVRTLISAGADVHVRDEERRSLIQLAALNMRGTSFNNLRRVTAVTEVLLASGAPSRGGDPSALETIQTARAEHRDRKPKWYPGGPLGARVGKDGPTWDEFDLALSQFEALVA